MHRPIRQKSSFHFTAKNADKHLLYEASVQSAEANVDFLNRVFYNRRKRDIFKVREDFCGTARFCCEWALDDPRNEIWGVDLNASVLKWCRRNHFPIMEDSAVDRITLLNANVLEVETPPVDAVLAFNFSYYIFKERQLLAEYFTKVKDALVDDGIFFLDAFGGPEGCDETEDIRKIKNSTSFSEEELPPFEYIWEQTNYNQLNHHMKCYISFAFSDDSVMKRAFRYDWRIWTLPEIKDLLLEVGFKDVHFYMQGWDDDKDDSDDVFRRRTMYNDLAAWFGYIVAEK
mgnify:CR=1 FL=1